MTRFFIIGLCLFLLGSLYATEEKSAGSQMPAVFSVPINLSNIFNMGFKDEVADDGQGGWTDQGPENDLRMLKTGSLKIMGLDFSIASEENNNGRTCLVISGKNEKFSSQTDWIPVSEEGNYLYLLHATAWTAPAGIEFAYIDAEFEDGTTETIPLKSMIDCGNWWCPFKLDNAAIAWTGDNAESYVGLYLSQFHFTSPPRRIAFRCKETICEENNLFFSPLWMIVAAAQGTRELELKQADSPYYVVESNGYTILNYTGKTLPSTPLDFSFMVEAPAGKYGPVIITEDGHFAFRDTPEKRIKFFGPNLIDVGNYVDHALANDFADKMNRLGYNCVRFHHFETPMRLQKDAVKSTQLDPERLEHLDYLVAALKAKGIYITFDLYASRFMLPGDGIAELEGLQPVQTFEAMKSLLPVCPAAMNSWKEFARALLTHRNPYTGLTWGEDPVFWSINMVNEAPLVWCWNRCEKAIPLYEAKFAEFLQKREMDTPENRANRSGLFREFLNSLEQAYYQEMKDFLVNDLKCTILTSNANNERSALATGNRARYDFVDNHMYHDHPTFPERAWSLPNKYTMQSCVETYLNGPRWALFPQRIYGKPYTVTEYDFCKPNIWRAENAALVGGFAAFQDWDGLCRFAWSHGAWPMEDIRQPMHFDEVNDPMCQLSERVINMLFVRGDVKPAEEAYAYTFYPERMKNLQGPLGPLGNYPMGFSVLALFGRIGSLTEDTTWPGVTKLDASADWRAAISPAAARALEQVTARLPITTCTGQITLDADNKSIKVCTEKSEVLCFEGGLSGNVMTITNAEPYQSVAILALDDKPLTESNRILLVHIVEVYGHKLKFRNQDKTILENWGTPPLMVRNAKADIELALPEMKVEALKLDGSLNGDVPAQYQDGHLKFTIDTTMRKGGVMAYILTRK